MQWRSSFIPTLRDDPAEAEAISHKLLVRAGFVRQLMSGSYSLLPLGLRVCQKITGVLRHEIDAIGGQEFRLPALHPGEVWQRSGRWDSVGEELFRVRDRRGVDLCLAMTHEEIFALLAGEVRSYKALPQVWYQIQTKFRDEPRPKSGVLRVREFTMKDSYSLDLDREGLDRAFQSHFDAYRRIFDRLGLDSIAVEASSGVMGGSESVEFMVQSEAGEDLVAFCSRCGYAANLEKATSVLAEVDDGPGLAAPEKFATPGVRTIEALAGFEGGAPAERQIKTLVYRVDGELVVVLLRGDHSLVEQKLADGLEAHEVAPADEAEIRELLGASPGSLGAVGVAGTRVVADPSLDGRRDMTTGANEDGFHLRGVDVARDIPVGAWLDLREVASGEPCPMCSNPLAVRRTIEVGHIFKLGTRYSEALDARVLDANGKSVPIVMGCYGIGVERTMAAVVERHHDDVGIIWPVTVAPFEVVVSVLNPKDVETSEAGMHLYESLRDAGVDVILDDRDERPGVKFKDAELVGIPFRLTVGPKGRKDKKGELTRRRTGQTSEFDLHHAAENVIEMVAEERR